MTTREDLFTYCEEQYGVAPDHPWRDTPDAAVLRHPASRKWFALVMDVPAASLGLPGSGRVDAVNLKCDPLLIGSLRSEPGVHPAYHMNKEHWITVVLDSPFPTKELLRLLDFSYDLTR